MPTLVRCTHRHSGTQFVVQHIQEIVIRVVTEKLEILFGNGQISLWNGFGLVEVVHQDFNNYIFLTKNPCIVQGWAVCVFL